MVNDCAIDCEVLEVEGVVAILDVDKVAGLELTEKEVDVVVVRVKMVDLQLGRRGLGRIVVGDALIAGVP
jgi:hypothetical protein